MINKRKINIYEFAIIGSSVVLVVGAITLNVIIVFVAALMAFFSLFCEDQYIKFKKIRKFKKNSRRVNETSSCSKRYSKRKRKEE